MTMADYKYSLFFTIFLLWCFAPLMGCWSFTIGIGTTQPATKNKKAAFLLRYENDDVNDVGAAGEPTFFQMQQIPTATTGTRLDHVVDCAENGLCDVDEMFAMIEELETLNSECQVSTSRECSLDAVAARNVLKVALASRVVLERNTNECVYDDDDTTTNHEGDTSAVGADDNPYSTFNQMDDLCNDGIHSIPTAAMKDADLERIIQCAEDGECPVGEMAEIIDELERLNNECSGTISRECSLDAVEARNILKVAIASQAAVAREFQHAKQQP